MCELSYAITSSMCSLLDKVKTIGIVKKRKTPKGYNVYSDPSYHEQVEETYCDF